MSTFAKLAGVYAGCSIIGAAYGAYTAVRMRQNIRILDCGLVYETTGNKVVLGRGDEIAIPTTTQVAATGAAVGAVCGLLIPAAAAATPALAVASVILV